METTIEKPYVIGLDMGGTNSVFGIVDQRGTIKAQTAIKTTAYPDFKDYVKASVEALQPALDLVGGISQIRGMGWCAEGLSKFSSQGQLLQSLYMQPHVLALASQPPSHQYGKK